MKPFSPDQMRDAIANAQNILNAPRHAETSVDRPHVMVAVLGVRGGVGASTVATSLCWLFSNKESRSTGMLDLDIHFGNGSLRLILNQDAA